MTSERTGRYFVSAGEYSGDLIAAKLVLSLKRSLSNYRPFGIVGTAMRQVSVEELIGQEKFSMIGLWEVAKRIGDLSIMEKYLLNKIDELQPDFAVLIDFPGLHFRLAEQLKLRGIPVYQYVAPKVWAWGEKRVKNLREDFEMVLGILPFEEEFFRKNEVNYSYVGSPILDRVMQVDATKADFGVADDEKLVGILPGSRVSELRYILPKIIETVVDLQRKHKNLRFQMPLANNLSFDDLQGVIQGPYSLKAVSRSQWQLGPINIRHGQSLDLMKAADVVLVASGTATLECALLETPMVVLYVTDQGTYDIAKAAVKVSYLSLVNLIVGRELVKEFIQEFSIDQVVSEVGNLLAESDYREKMIEQFKKMKEELGGNAAERAAEKLVSDLESKSYVCRD